VLRRMPSVALATAIMLVSVALAVVVLLLSNLYDGGAPVAAQTSPAKPNFIFIIADDMRYDDLKYMPKTRNLLGSKGMTFSRAYFANPLCCPSRTSVLTGMYTHNHNVWFNSSSSEGGWQGFKAQGHEQDNLATRLSTAGYRTGLIGQYVKNYDGSSKPPGWDDWFAHSGGSYYGLKVNDNGTLRRYGNTASGYSTDVYSKEAQEFIATSASTGKPFFAYVAPTAPHYPTKAAPRDLNTYDGLKAPRPLSFNEANVSDKPPWISSLPPLSASQIAQIDTRQEDRAETLQALDDLVEGVVNTLNTTKAPDGTIALNNTYIFFTSDNGFEMGEHRIFDGKRRPYEESAHAPLLVRGPEVTAGSTTDKLALNIDFFPTLADLGGLQTPSYVDGRSLRPVLNGSATTSTWRSAILLETRFESGTAKNFYGIRTSDGMKYIEYGGGFRELYDLKPTADPYELSNIYKATSPPTSLAARLQALKGCAGESCRAAENGP
jgi:N-acetylglucosamine-6-sulfatase